MTKNQPQLFGRPIFTQELGLTLTSQVREILLEEIHNGRWEVGDRLPSVAVLARLSGLSRWPIQEAFERLRKEGYLHQSERSGTYLASLAPKGRKPLGSIGVAMVLAEEAGSWTTAPFLQYRLSRILEMAEQRHFAIEIKYLRPDDDWAEIDRVGSTFSDSVIGVISLNTFPHPAQIELPPNRLPFVYLGGNTNECLPTVAGDTMSGFYQLTKHIIDLGHRDIICFLNPNDTEQENQNRLMGHERAMHEVGLTVNTTACQRSLQIQEGDLMAIRSYLEEFHEATAIICMWGAVDTQIVQVATMMGLRVPEDLSVTGHGAGPMGANYPSKTMTCLEYDMDAMINACFDLLQAQKQRRRAEMTLVLSNPLLHKGDSLAAPQRESDKLPKAEHLNGGKLTPGAPVVN
jgi:DNA-binding LacI/PurR family transcriptional regulator